MSIFTYFSFNGISTYVMREGARSMEKLPSLIDKTSLEYFLDELHHLERNKNKIQEQIDTLLLTKNFK